MRTWSLVRKLWTCAISRHPSHPPNKFLSCVVHSGKSNRQPTGAVLHRKKERMISYPWKVTLHVGWLLNTDVLWTVIDLHFHYTGQLINSIAMTCLHDKYYVHDMAYWESHCLIYLRLTVFIYPWLNMHWLSHISIIRQLLFFRTSHFSWNVNVPFKCRMLKECQRLVLEFFFSWLENVRFCFMLQLPFIRRL